MKDEDIMDQVVEILKALGEENRLRILVLLEQAGELSVADIGHALELPQPKVSRHLGRLRLAGWVKERRWRGFAMYRVVLPQGNVHREYLLHLMQELQNDSTMAMDMQRLFALRKTKNAEIAREQIESENIAE
jgi:ArsR family transcriptional regulator, arsenate/arsenite/antimonite-responsive transcriptional repressor